jgi:hypothetical protein
MKSMRASDERGASRRSRRRCDGSFGNPFAWVSVAWASSVRRRVGSRRHGRSRLARARSRHRARAARPDEAARLVTRTAARGVAGAGSRRSLRWPGSLVRLRWSFAVAWPADPRRSRSPERACVGEAAPIGSGSAPGLSRSRPIPWSASGCRSRTPAREGSPLASWPVVRAPRVSRAIDGASSSRGPGPADLGVASERRCGANPRACSSTTCSRSR